MTVSDNTLSIFLPSHFRRADSVLRDLVPFVFKVRLRLQFTCLAFLYTGVFGRTLVQWHSCLS